MTDQFKQDQSILRSEARKASQSRSVRSIPRSPDAVLAAIEETLFVSYTSGERFDYEQMARLVGELKRALVPPLPPLRCGF